MIRKRTLLGQFLKRFAVLAVSGMAVLLMALSFSEAGIRAESGELSSGEGWARDPFVEVRMERKEERNRPEEDAFWLTGILHRGERRIAIINRVVVREGDSIYGAEVTKIEPDRVLLEKNEREITLRLGGS